MRLAYLVNQYPKISHSFIRREILALEQMGLDILTISLRGWETELADDEDRAERARTRYVLRSSAVRLLLDTTRMLLMRPARLLRALARAWHMSRLSDRPLYVHFVYVIEACRIERWLRENRIEHLHAHFGTNSAEVAMYVGMLGGPPWSFTAHGIESFDNPRLAGLTEKVTSADFVVTVSSYGKTQIYRSVEPRHWHKVHVVHCGLDRTFRITASDTPSSRSSLVCVGRLSPEKGHLVLIEAVEQLVKRGVDLRMTLAGDGELRSEIEQTIARRHLVDRVRITGWLSSQQVREEILGARALVLPSFAEGLPVVIMEAMALRRPVIATYVAGIPELVQPGQHGWLVPAGDVMELADAMRACLAAPADEIARMGEAARQRVLERHDVNTEARKLQKLFCTAADIQLD